MSLPRRLVPGPLARWRDARLAARAERARHNDLDAACVHWWGDRRPDPDDRANHEFGGDPTWVMLRRCLVCRPHTTAEADALVEHDPTADAAA